jgi:hypothetical protein
LAAGLPGQDNILTVPAVVNGILFKRREMKDVIHKFVLGLAVLCLTVMTG